MDPVSDRPPSTLADPPSAAADLPPSGDPVVVARTQQLDVFRAIPAGVVVPFEASVLLTIAITRFEAPGWVKGVIAAAGGVGLLLSPLVTAVARHRARPVMSIAATTSAVGAIGFVIASTGSLAAFVVGSVVAIAAVSAVVPLVTTMYERNFPAHQRGRRVGWGMSVRVATSALAGLAMGEALTAEPGSWPILLLAGAVAMGLVARLQWATPSEPLAHVEGRLRRRGHHAFPHFELLAVDRRLRLTLIAWMFMGFGNLMLLPLRVEYLARPSYGIAATAATITLLTVTVPSVVRLACIPLFGRLFDRMTFFSARILVNLLFAAYVVAFFTGTSWIALAAGAVVFGIATAGGDLLWALWVTKFAPAGRVADYMGLHTFFTGVRAVVAPLVAFAVVERLSLGWIAVLAAGLMVVSSAMLFPEARVDRALSGRSA